MRENGWAGTAERVNARRTLLEARLSNRLLLAAARSTTLRQRVEHGRLGRSAARRFVAGEGSEDAADAIQAVRRRGLMATVNLLGEDTTTEAHTRAAVDGYARLLEVLVQRRLTEDTDVSVKLSALGLTIAESLALENLLEVSSMAERVHMSLTVDMEGPQHVNATLRLAERARRESPSIGVVVQAYLRRTEDDCRGLTSAGCRVRLCKGAYAAASAVAFASRPQVREAFERSLEILMRGNGYPMVATHDPRLISMARSMAASCHRGTSQYELQMLYGVRPEEQARLVREGCRVRVYIPFGDNWYGYFVRRVAERPANLAFAVRAVLSRS